MEDLDPGITGQLLFHRHHGLVDGPCPPAAPEGQQGGLVRIQAELFQSLFPGGFQDFPAHRIAGEELFGVGGEITAPLLVAQEHLVHEPGQDLVGDSGHGVLFLDAGGHPFHGRPEQYGSAHIAPGADHQVRIDPVQQAVGLLHAQEQFPGAFQGAQAQVPLKARHIDEFQGISVPGDDVLLQSLPGPHKSDFTGRVQPPQRPGNGQCRIDVAAGSPAGQYDFHAFASLARSMTICLNTRPRSGKLANMS